MPFHLGSHDNNSVSESETGGTDSDVVGQERVDCIAFNNSAIIENFRQISYIITIVKMPV